MGLGNSLLEGPKTPVLISEEFRIEADMARRIPKHDDNYKDLKDLMSFMGGEAGDA